MRALELALSAAWAMEEQALRGVLEIAAREHEPTPQAMEAYRAQALERGERAGIRNGVAVLDVTGPLFRYANLMTEFCGATSYDVLRRDLAAALDDPAVHAVLLSVDSPGGEANGAAELAQAVFDARGRKPIVAYVGGMGASAAYWIASAADEIVADATALLGSIGVRMGVRDRRQADERAGIRTIDFVSSQSPGKAADPATAEGAAAIQATIDALAEVFVGTVARNRGVDRSAVLERFGGGGVLVGQDAVAAGLADRLGSFEGVLAEMAARTPHIGAVGGARFTAASGGASERISTMTDPVTGAPAPAPAVALTAEAVASQHPAIAAQFRAEGAAQERERIAAIQGLAVAGHEALTAEAIASGLTAEAYAVKLLTAQKARGGDMLARIAGDEAALKAPGPGASGEVSEAGRIDALAKAIAGVK